MKPPKEAEALRHVVEMLGRFLDAADRGVRLEPAVGRDRADAAVQFASFTFVVQWQGSATAALVAQAARQARHVAAEMRPKAIPLVAVPFMGEVGREQCAQLGVSWLDLSGNAMIVGQGLRIDQAGRGNAFRRPGRPSSVFAPKSSRIARWFLTHPTGVAMQRVLAINTDLDEGYTSRIVRRLIADGFLARISLDADPGPRRVAGRRRSGVKVLDPDVLLDAWRAEYDFTAHPLIPRLIFFRNENTSLI